MKNLILSLLTLGSVSLLTTTAQADHRERYVRYYDHCGRPVYGYIERDRCETYGSRSYYYQRSSDYRPRYSYESSRRSYYPRDYSDCQPRYSRSRSGISFFFGF